MPVDGSESPDASLLGFVDPSEILRRVARSLREEVGPKVEADYSRTQAFMAAVILEQLACQVRSVTFEVGTAESSTLVNKVSRALGPDVPTKLATALRGLSGAMTRTELSGLVAALHGSEGEIDTERLQRALEHVRATMRRRLDQQLAVLA